MDDHTNNQKQRLQGLLLNIEHRKHIDLSQTGFSDSDMPILQGNKNVEFLKLEENPITDAGLRRIDGLPNLCHLQLRMTNVELKGDSYGIGCFPQLPSLELLDLSFSLVNNVSIFKQLRHKTPELLHLNMNGVRVFRWDRDYLSQLPVKIRSLNLSGVPMSTYALSALTCYESLIHLTLRYCELTDEHLCALGRLTTLQVLELGSNRITTAQMAELRQRLRAANPSCIVTT